MAFLDDNGVETLVSTLKDKIASLFASKSELGSKQDVLVSGTNIKTVNNNSLVGSGNISIEDKEANRVYYTDFGRGTLKAKTIIRARNFVFTALDGRIISSATSSGTETSKTLTTESFDPFGPIYYFNYWSDSSTSSYLLGQYTFLLGQADIRYGFNVATNSLEKGIPVYVKCTPQSDGSVKLAGDDCITQALPVSEDGYVYIRLGIAYGDSTMSTSANYVNLTTSHPVYEYRNGMIRHWMPISSTVASHSATGNYAKILTFEATGENVTAPITMEFIRTGDTRPTEITFCFGSGNTLTFFTSNNVTDAYLHYASSVWTLYIRQASASDKVEVLDFHNPWSNTDLTIEWNDTSISTLPTGATQASIASIPNSYGDLKGTGEHIYESPSSISITNGATKTVGSITLSKGVWLLIGMAQFNTNATGRRKAYFADSSDSATDLGAIYKDTQRAVDGDSTQCSVVAYYANTSSSKTLYFIATQNSGSTITTTGRLMAIKIA